MTFCTMYGIKSEIVQVSQADDEVVEVVEVTVVKPCCVISKTPLQLCTYCALAMLISGVRTALGATE